MATRKKSSNKARMNGLTHEALLSITPSTNLNASLINPKFTPLPSSRFSTKFRTSGTVNPIKGDFLQRPTTSESKYASESVPSGPVIGSFSSDTPGRGPGKTQVTVGRSVYDLSPADFAAWNTATQAVTDATARNTAKSTLLSADTTAFKNDAGIRTIAMNRSTNRSGSTGPNGVL